ncbi:MAG: hypothetical protein BGO12_12675 [Verrucomicrobia bacterium 61-8]|nr:hypothetical protein [Verrucomicrobiota bacterium]OJU97591.1 MAG: hypothetical protein BGO12_12675 [Verrucomicrobia bacterium 61-8]
MKTRLALLFLALAPLLSFAEALIPSSVDPAQTAEREKLFIPWSNPGQADAYWNKLSSSNVPIYNEREAGNLSRDLYIPNPGLGYWVLGGLSKKELFRIHKEKLEIGDTLISATVYQNPSGNEVYWALWAPAKRAHLLTEKMRELGITQARIEPTLADKVLTWSASLKPLSPAITWASLVLNVILLILVLLLIISLARKPGAA